MTAIWKWFCLLLACSLAASADEPALSRPVRAWEFVDAAGPKASLLGREDGVLEAYVYPLKICKDLRLQFRSDGRTIPAAAIARRIDSRPGAYTISYTGDDFRVTETLVAPQQTSGVLIRLTVDSRSPLQVDVLFTRDFQLMWPAAIGSSYGEWSDDRKGFVFGADGYPYAAVFGSRDAGLLDREYATNYSGSAASGFTLGTINGHGERVLAIAGSMKSRDEAVASYETLLARPAEWQAETERFYRDYLARTVQLRLPDPVLQRAYDWSRVSVLEGFVDNPMLGRGLVAGYGPSKGAYRPGFAWFFGRDSFWTSFALTSSGDFANSRAAIAFIARFQRDDGKIPHEISQSASLVPWFTGFPYGYASADATPLFIVAVRDYVQASGDVAFAREQAPRLWKAFEFMRSTLDEAGFPKNIGVGHGWVEGGRLLPVRTELYQAACYVEALRSLSILAGLLGDAQRARELQADFTRQHAALDRLFWLPRSGAYAFALDTQGRTVNHPSVLAAVPMWFGLLDLDHSQQMIEELADEPHASDWGMRIISSRDKLYDPSGYHFGSVWPLFTGWASVGEYRKHEAQPALANLRANAWLAVDGAGGNTTEVLSGDSYSPLSTASPHQIWSAAMVVSPLLRGLLGLELDAVQRTVTFAPHLPADWNDVSIHALPIGSGKVDLDLHRTAETLELSIVNHASDPFELQFAPAYPPCAEMVSATMGGGAVAWRRESGNVDWHPRMRLRVQPGLSRLTVRHRGMFGYAVPFQPPQLAGPSAALKVISERWGDNNQTLELTVAGRPSRAYRLDLAYPDRLAEVQGAVREGAGSLMIRMPDAATDEYVSRKVLLRLRATPDAGRPRRPSSRR